MNPADTEALKALVALAKKATPGPWTKIGSAKRTLFTTAQGQQTVAPDKAFLPVDIITCLRHAEQAQADCDFVQAARNAMPALSRLLEAQAGQKQNVVSRRWLIVWRDGTTTITDRAPDSYECRESKSMHSLETILEGVPEGWQLVPKKLTPKMSEAMGYTDDGTEASWEHALAAAPHPPSEGEQT